MLVVLCCFVFLMIRRPPRSTQSRSSAASDVYKRQTQAMQRVLFVGGNPFEQLSNVNNIATLVYDNSGLTPSINLCPGQTALSDDGSGSVSYTHLRAHETVLDLVCRLLLEKKKQNN